MTNSEENSIQFMQLNKEDLAFKLSGQIQDNKLAISSNLNKIIKWKKMIFIVERFQ